MNTNCVSGATQKAKGNVSISSVVVAQTSQLSCELADEAVILDLQSGIYYGLNETGSQIWRMMSSPISVREIVDAISRDYDVDQVTCSADVLALLTDLEARALIRISEA